MREGFGPLFSLRQRNMCGLHERGENFQENEPTFDPPSHLQLEISEQQVRLKPGTTPLGEKC